MRLQIAHHAQFPDPFERERIILEMIHYGVRIVYTMILIVVALLALGGIIA